MSTREAARLKLSLVFPAWNEEEMLDQTVSAATEAAHALEASGEITDYEIIHRLASGRVEAGAS